MNPFRVQAIWCFSSFLILVFLCHNRTEIKKLILFLSLLNPILFPGNLLSDQSGVGGIALMMVGSVFANKLTLGGMEDRGKPARGGREGTH